MPDYKRSNMKSTSFLFYFLSILLFTSCAKGPQKQVLSGEALGTTYQVIYYAQDFELEKAALDSIFEQVNQSMSTYRETSDISRINKGDSLIEVDTLFQNVLRLSQQVHQETWGYFDPTVGTLVNYYGFGPKLTTIQIDTLQVDSLMNFVGLDKVRLDDRGMIIKTAPEVYLDFNAIAKGYTVDLMGHYLESKEVEHYLIELGGELLARGENLDKTAPWKVGVDDPRQKEGERTLTAAIVLQNRAMATSGNYRKNRIDPTTGMMYVHTIDPLTGYATKSDVLSASVLAENCAVADAYATAFMAMGLEKTKEVLPKLEGVDAFLIYATENGEAGEYLTEGFEKVKVEL